MGHCRNHAIRLWIALAVHALLSLLYVSFAFAQSSAPGELDLVRSAGNNSAFVEVLRLRAPISMVARDGAVGRNARKYEHAAHQREVIWLAMRAVIENDSRAMENVVKALEYGFSWQTQQGNFKNTRGASAVKAVGADAFFLQGYCRIQYLIMNSQFAEEYGARFATMNQKLDPAVDWLKRNRKELLRQDKNATNRLFFDAMALGLCGQIIGDKDATALGAQFAERALANQRADGTFNEHGGFDSSYQAVSVLNIAGFVQNMDDVPRSELMRSMAQAAAWLKTRIAEDGSVITKGNERTGVGREGDKEVNYAEVMTALFFAGHMLGQPEYDELGEKVANYILDNAK